MPKIISFHGFNISDQGKNSTDKLKPYIDITDVDYGWMWLFRVRACNRCIAASIINLIPEGSVAIAHSNGALIAVKAVEIYRERQEAQLVPEGTIRENYPFRKLILINPALNSDYKFPKGLHVDVYHTPTDQATLMAKYIPFSKWGALGRVGYTGDSPYVYNYNNTKLFGSVTHSDVFDSAEDLSLHILSGLR